MGIYDEVQGAVVVGVDKTDAGSVTLRLADGRGLRLQLDGDCCSDSFYTDLAQFDELRGATIRSVEERDGESRPGLDDEAIAAEKVEGTYREEVSWHFLVFTTNKGHITIDWRNDSNGYYDGSVAAAIETAAP